MSDQTARQPGLDSGCVPYTLQPGEGRHYNVAGQVMTILAGGAETAGSFGVLMTTAPLDRAPVPMHWHEREHDTWFCVGGKVQLWADGRSRILEAGDFAYVKPGDPHSYRSLEHGTRIFGIVAPGGWEKFFGAAGEPWPSAMLPPPDRPFDFGRLMGAMSRYDVWPVQNPSYAEPERSTASGDLPGRPVSYFLGRGSTPGHVLDGLVCTPLLTGAETSGLFAVQIVEARAGSELPAHLRPRAHGYLHLLEGEIDLGLGGERHLLGAGASANVPAGTVCAIAAPQGARWLAISSGGHADRWLPAAAADWSSDRNAGSDEVAAALRRAALDAGVVLL